MSKKDIIQAIRDKEMDRKDFLKYSGLLVLGLTGFKTIANLLLQPETKLGITDKKQVSRGFGSGKYGA